MGARSRLQIVGREGPLPAEEPASSAPPIVRKLLGAALLRHRSSAGLTGPQVVAAGRISSAPKLSRIENGGTNARFSEADVLGLLDLYGVPVDSEDHLSVMSRAQRVLAAGKPWWPSNKDVVAAAFNDLLHVEATASEIVTFEGNHIPGLLQSPAYMSAVLSVPYLDRVADAALLKQRKDVRLKRQEVLEPPSALEYTAIIDEAALWRPVGGKAVMLEQLRRLHARCERGGNVHIRVFPTKAWAEFPPLTTAMTLLKLPAQEGPSEMLYVEATNVSASWVEDEVRLAEHKASLLGVMRHSFGKAATLAFLEERIDELAGGGL